MKDASRGPEVPVKNRWRKGIFKRHELGAQREAWRDEACVEDN